MVKLSWNKAKKLMLPSIIVFWLFFGWPPVWLNPRFPTEVKTTNAAAITYVGRATGTNSATLPTFQAGDLAVVFAYRDGSTTVPSLASGWTNIGNSGANTNSSRVGYRVLQSGDTTTGTWTNATSLVVQVYRGQAASPIGASSGSGAASTTVTYNALSLQVTNGSSWVIGFAGHRSTNTNLQNAPTGMTNRSTVVDATDEAAGHDTNAGVSSWTAKSVSVAGTSSGWRAWAIEIKALNSAPSQPSQDSPTNSQTDVSTTPTFTMTATDSDTDDVSYKVTIYSDNACTTTLQTHDQAVDSTGWSGTNTTCTAQPTNCYTSGTQGTYTMQAADALANNTQYWWRASAKDPDGATTFTNSSTCNSFTTVAAATISVTITSDGIINYGTLAASQTKTTIELSDTQTASNDGNVAEDFNIKGQNTTCPWTLGPTTNADQYVHNFSINGGGQWTALTTSYQSLISNVAASGSQSFDLQIAAPSSTNCFDAQNVDVTIQAVQH